MLFLKVGLILGLFMMIFEMENFLRYFMQCFVFAERSSVNASCVCNKFVNLIFVATSFNSIVPTLRFFPVVAVGNISKVEEIWTHWDPCCLFWDHSKVTRNFLA